MENLRNQDPAVLEAMNLELKRQRNNIELIASENIVSEAVMEAMGSVLTNKYAEGYPGKRYYGGCERVDIVENIARDRAKELFGAEHANVQPHSGAQANLAVYLAALKPGDTVLGMNLAHGGHLTHGSPVNASGLFYNFVAYGVQEDTFLIDYDEVRKAAFKHRPRLIVAGASAYPRIIDFEKLASIAKRRWRALHGRYGAYRRPRGCGSASEPGAACPFRDDDDPQDAARPARRDDFVQTALGSRHRQSGIPGYARRPADARHRFQSGCIGRSASAFF
ncbi:hypothetical protein HMSSN139_66200 [Paenibacillus sp. HMSSN-139]|nr:hypothetical protein HMSSN139_66200 [Paenibacillus sp. HMSSN-139]